MITPLRLKNGELIGNFLSELANDLRRDYQDTNARHIEETNAHLKALADDNDRLRGLLVWLYRETTFEPKHLDDPMLEGIEAVVLPALVADGVKEKV